MLKNKRQTTQDFVPIKEIRDGVVISKNNTMSVVLMASSINFGLKSGDEQTATLVQFQNFLNSLDFPVQILMQSRRADIRPYLRLLEERFQAQTNDLMRVQVSEYMRFIQTFTDQVDIMKKSFYVVVSYSPAIISKGGVGSIIKSATNTDDSVMTAEKFNEFRGALQQRISMVEQGLQRTGVRTVALGTEELIELFHHTFNPADLTINVPTN